MISMQISQAPPDCRSHPYKVPLLPNPIAKLMMYALCTAIRMLLARQAEIFRPRKCWACIVPLGPKNLMSEMYLLCKISKAVLVLRLPNSSLEYKNLSWLCSTRLGLMFSLSIGLSKYIKFVDFGHCIACV